MPGYSPYGPHLVMLAGMAVAGLDCQHAITQATTSFFHDDSSKWTYMDLLAIQHGKPNKKKCNFMKTTMSAINCLDAMGMCQTTTHVKRDKENVQTKQHGPTQSERGILEQRYGPGMFNEHGRGNVTAKTGRTRRSHICNAYNPYRTLDGSCNNLYYTHDGMQGILQRRFLAPDYDNGYNTPKVNSHCIGGATLPSARLVSNIIHAADAIMDLDSTRSLFIMQMGQFLAHDLVLTPMETRSNGEPLDCCGVDNSNPNCFPINIPPNDPRFVGCMNLARSEGETYYGKLKSVLNKLPRDVNDELCQPSQPTDPQNYYCTIAGDARVNEEPGLNSLHTIFLREHNRIATALAQRHPTWNDEKLFQEARKINIGEWQHIVFNEYLPATIGTQAMQKYNLWVSTSGYRDTYWSEVDPSIVNSFAAAVMRFGHSLVPNKVKLTQLDDEVVFAEEDVKDNFFEPNLYHSNSHMGTDNILKWMSSTACPLSDRKLETSIQQFLFLDSNGDSLDLASLNIQRGRDHGLFGYNWFRYYICGLSWVYNFGTSYGGLVDHEPAVAQLLSQAYACADDIDLFTGHMTEKRRPGSQLGPTGECIMGFQMRRLRDGDRFFYERYDYYAGGFTLSQLAQIKSVRMSDLFCLNTGSVPGKRIQRNMFLQQGSTNAFVDCATVQGVDFTYW